MCRLTVEFKPPVGTTRVPSEVPGVALEAGPKRAVTNEVTSMVVARRMSVDGPNVDGEPQSANKANN